MTRGETPRIVISYRREDSGVITGRIFDRLVGHYGREAIFLDIDSIPFGVNFRRHIDDVLSRSSIMLAIVGPRWLGPDSSHSRLANEADPVRLEIEATLQANLPLIPVLVLGGTMPTTADLPEAMREFAYRNAIRVDASQDFDIHMSRLLNAIDGILRRRYASAPDQEEPRSSHRRRHIVLTILLLIGAFIFISYIYWIHEGISLRPPERQLATPTQPPPVPPIRTPEVSSAGT